MLFIFPNLLGNALHSPNRLDFADHEGSHPTLGVVDHISFSPIGDESIERTQSIANEFCAQLSGAHPDLSVCCYGHLDPSHVRLQHLRRSLGYFQHDYKQALFTAIKESDKDLPSARFGPQLQPPSSFLKHKGLTCVGVVPWVQNFNVKFASHHKKSDITPITQAVRCPEVEALTLLHEDGAYEIACNLLQPRLVGRDIVLQRIQDLVLSEKQRSGEELVLESWYTTGPDEDELLRRSSLSRTAVDS